MTMVRNITRRRFSMALLFLSLSLSLGGCGGPLLMIPGGELVGEVVQDPITDWSFVSDTFIDLETRPEDPYSVELNYVVRDGKLYIDPADDKTWYGHIKADPRVRARFAGKIYPLTAVLVDDPNERAGFDVDRFVYRLESRAE